jgi:hypothetical protein
LGRDRPFQSVSESLVVEAKVTMWRGGLRQLAQTRGMTQRGALLVPEPVVRLIDRRVLKKYGVGLLSYSESGSISWVRSSPRRSISLAARLWMGEWAVRGRLDPQLGDAFKS